jgi:hypothetical protein
MNNITPQLKISAFVENSDGSDGSEKTSGAVNRGIHFDELYFCPNPLTFNVNSSSNHISFGVKFP